VVVDDRIAVIGTDIGVWEVIGTAGGTRLVLSEL
jgi:hypothetical protein